MTILANPKGETLIAAGEVVELRFKDGNKALSLRSAKLFHLLVNHAGAKACDDIEHVVPIAELNFFHSDAEQFVDCVRDLVGTLVELTTKKDGKTVTLVDPLLFGVQRDHDVAEGMMVYRLSPTLRTILKHSNHWAALSRDAVLAFESRYALRLYELIALRANLKHKNRETFDLADLRRRLGVPDGKLSRWVDLRRFAIEPAIAELNQLSGFTVAYEAEKRGRRVDRVTLSWAQADASERGAAARELSGASVGRKARRNGTAETVTDAPALPRERLSFPAYGSIKHGAERVVWRDIAEKHAQRLPGGHLPDLGGLSEQFRAWCDDKRIPLDAPGIEKTFIGFCKKYKPLMSQS